MPINGCYTLVELLNLNCMEEEMPCAPCNPSNPTSSDCPIQTPFTECCSGDIGLGHNLYTCRYPTGCGDATYPSGLNMNINSWPNTGNPVFAYRAFDCTDGISETGMMVYNPTTGARNGFFASLRQVPGNPATGMVTRLVDGASNVIPGSSFTTSYYNPTTGKYYSVYADGVIHADGGLVINDDIVDGAGNVLVSVSGGGGSGPAPSSNPVTDVSLSGSTLTFTYEDGTTENITLPTSGGGGGVIDDTNPGGPIIGDPSWTYPISGYSWDLAIPKGISFPDNMNVAIFNFEGPGGATTPVVGLAPDTVSNASGVVGSVVDSGGNLLTRGILGHVNGGTNYAAYFDGPVHITGPATCTAGSWSDYVFSPDYELPDFGEYMEETLVRGAFPNMPTEEEVAESLNLAEFAQQLLEKVEMIYLYHGRLLETLEQKGVI